MWKLARLLCFGMLGAVTGLHRSPLFWLGLLPALFIVWAWRDSYLQHAEVCTSRSSLIGFSSVELKTGDGAIGLELYESKEIDVEPSSVPSRRVWGAERNPPPGPYESARTFRRRSAIVPGGWPW